MSVGIIYRAYNKTSGKSYVGQTLRPLIHRIREHFLDSRKFKSKFGNALISYDRDVWEWTILKEVDIEKLDEYEKFFIEDLDTFNNGYNATKGETWSKKNNTTRHKRQILELYHKDYGVFKGYRFELMQLDPNLSGDLHKLLSGKYLSCLGWVLLENKDRYEVILAIHTFYHPEVGIVKCTPGELDRDYIHPLLPKSEKKRRIAKALVCAKNPTKSCYGWTVLKDIIEEESSEKV